MKKFFSVDTKNISFEEVNNGDFLKVDMYAISTGKNRNGSYFLEESMEPGIPTVYNKPILAYYDPELDDVQEHNSRMKLDDEDNVWFDYQYAEGERPVGVIPESATISIKEKDGKKWLYIENALIWTEYNKQLIDLIKRQLKKKVSVEIDVCASYEEDGTDMIKQWKFLGITILGKEKDGTDIQPGIDGAHLKVKDVANSMVFRNYRENLNFALNNNKSDNILDKYGIVVSKNRRETMALTHRELEDKLWAAVSGYTYERNGYTNHKYWIEDVVEDGNKVIIRDNETNEVYSVPYHLDDEGKIHVDMSEKKIATKKYEEFADRDIQVYLAKDEYGSEKALRINKSKEAVSHDKWGEVNKTDLRNNVLKAKNYKTLVKAVYLEVGADWEKKTSELKYPVMQIKDDEVVYNAGGLLSAQQYGEKYDEAVAKKALSLRKKLGLVEMDKKKFIAAAVEKGYVFLGESNGKLKFVEKPEDEKKEEMAKVVEACDSDLEKFNENEKEFKWDELTVKSLNLFDDDEDDDDDMDDDDDLNEGNHDEGHEEIKDKRELRKENAKLKKEIETLKMKCEELEDEIRMKEKEKFKEDTDAILADEDEDLDEHIKEELRKMRDDDKFACVDDFVKEIAYRKYLDKKEKEKKDDDRLSFGLNKSKKTVSKVEDTVMDTLKRI